MEKYNVITVKELIDQRKVLKSILNETRDIDSIKFIKKEIKDIDESLRAVNKKITTY